MKIPGELAAGLSEVDWNFDGVPDSELVACCYWEYARESAFIRDVRRRCAEAKVQGMTDGDVYRLLGKEFDKLQQIYPYELVVFDGFFGRIPFPCAWLDLHEPDRKERAKIELDRPLAFQRCCSVLAAELLLEEAKKRVDEYRAAEDKLHREYPGYGGGTLRRMGKWPKFNENCSVSWNEGTEVTIVEIAWGHYTNDQIVDAFRKWVRGGNRPKELSRPDARRDRPQSRVLRADLKRLAAMRLLHRHTFREIDRKMPEVWNAFMQHKWRDESKWYDARREALAVFRRLFPFLPQEERPLSWPTKGRQAKQAISSP